MRIKKTAKGEKGKALLSSWHTVSMINPVPHRVWQSWFILAENF